MEPSDRKHHDADSEPALHGDAAAPRLQLRAGGMPDDVAYAGTPLDPRAGPSAAGVGSVSALPRAAQVSPQAASDGTDLQQNIIAAIRTVFDPEIPVNIYDIGLIYEVRLDDTGHVGIRMTLTSPMCPAAESLPYEVEQTVAAVPGVRGVMLDLVWEPPWTVAMMSEDARLLLNLGT